MLIDPSSPAQQIIDSPHEPAQPTRPLDADSYRVPSHKTTPLPELGGAPTPLDAGALVADRYRVVSLLGSTADSNLYRVIDSQGYRHCWACGSENSLVGDTYCVECGAQLSGRQYRLQEFSLAGESLGLRAIPISTAVLENKIPGMVRVYSTVEDVPKGRVYVVWEETYGRTLLSWLPSHDEDIYETDADDVTMSAEPLPSEERIVGWLAKAAELLSNLHTEGIIGCSMELGNLLAQPSGDLLLLDPSSCGSIHGMATEEQASSQASDVIAIADQLERLYTALHSPPVASSTTAVVGAMSTLTDTTQELPVAASSMLAEQPTTSLSGIVGAAQVLAKAREGIYPTADAFAVALEEAYQAVKPPIYLQLQSASASHVGRVRKVNEDSVLTLQATVLQDVRSLPVGFYMIADGMGGHQSGEVASSIAIHTVGSVVNEQLITPLALGKPAAYDANACSLLLRNAVAEANRRIAGLALERESDLGTTAVMVLLVGGQACIANVGDSRVYLWHAEELTPITHDHSLVAQLVMAGQITADDVYTHPRRNEIYRALGESRLTESEVDIFVRRLQPGDALLVCSDGLWDFVRDPDIAFIISSTLSAGPQAVCNALVEAANKAGGEDNISAIFVQGLTAVYE